MRDDNGDTLRRVAWSEVLPWLVIFRTFRLAIRLPALGLGAAAILLTLTGWSLLGWVFSYSTAPEIRMTFTGDADGREIPPGARERAEQFAREPAARMDTGGWMRLHSGCPWLAIDAAVPDRPSVPSLSQILGRPGAATTAWHARDPYFGSWAQLSRPLWEAWRLDTTLIRGTCLLLCGLWAVAVWAFFGGAITRMSAVELACEERIGCAAALRHAGSKWLSYFAAPLMPLLGIALVLLPVIGVGLLLREAYVGAWVAAILWPLVLLAGLLAAMLLAGLIFGWPLMWPTISTEGTDSFDALSRCYAYVFGRPLHYLFYAVVAAVLGVLGWLLVSNFAAGVIWVSYWAASWGSGSETIVQIQDGSFAAAGQLVAFWVGCVKLLAVGFIYSYFWTASTAIYLLLRRDVDATEMDEVFLDEDASEQTYGLPPLTTDEVGAPVIDDDVPEVEPDDLDAPKTEAEGEGADP